MPIWQKHITKRKYADIGRVGKREKKTTTYVDVSLVVIRSVGTAPLASLCCTDDDHGGWAPPTMCMQMAL